ncbi:MAG: RNA ligase family protein [Lachnospiraceae bacterium]|nr:RNA ligase family protein [Lachnospiraceae bacterium]
MDTELKKYPRTPHLEGSRLQPGDEDLSQIPFSEIAGRPLVVEEKIDGANSAISFDENGTLLLQSRGHYLTGGYRERHYNLMKQWASIHQALFYQVLGQRYIMYGEWMYAKHSVFYDALPHYFMEFDIFDREEGIFLDTPGRAGITERLPVQSVPVLGTGRFRSQEELLKLLGTSRYISEQHLENLRAQAQKLGLDAERIFRETDSSRLMEGLYIKVEEDGCVRQRLKFVRASFLQTVMLSETHWLERPIVPNLVAGDLKGMLM